MAMRSCWHRDWSVTLYEHENAWARATPPRYSRRWQRYRLASRPSVWWTVVGKKWFDWNRSKAIRSSWRIGRYGG